MKNCFVMLLSAEVVKQVSRLSPSSSVSTRGPMVRIIPRCTMSKALNNTALRMCSKFKQNCVIVAQSCSRLQQVVGFACHLSGAYGLQHTITEANVGRQIGYQCVRSRIVLQQSLYVLETVPSQSFFTKSTRSIAAPSHFPLAS